MANKELEVINAICENKDISALLESNVDQLFTAYGDVYKEVKDYYQRHRSVPAFELLQQKFGKDAEGKWQVEKVETKAPTAYYLDGLKEEYIGARMEEIMVKAALARKGGMPPAQALDILTKSLGKLGQFTNAVRDLDVTDMELAREYYLAQAARAAEMGGSVGIPTGFKSIDSVYPTGMAAGHLVVAIGWPGKMKTWFTALLACKAWELGFRPMIVSLEMSPEGMRDRILTMMGSGMFRASDLARGDVDIDTFDAWGKKRFASKSEFVVVSNEGMGSVTPNTVQAKIDQHRPNLVICDYHQLFDNNGHSSNPTERGMAVSREFKLLAGANQLPIIDITAATASDISDRDTPPLMSQVAWSKAIEYDADLAFAVHRHEDSGLVEIVSRKNRWGGDFDFYLNWDVDRGVITEQFA
jgi:replicative DNA helicase